MFIRECNKKMFFVFCVGFSFLLMSGHGMFDMLETYQHVLKNTTTCHHFAREHANYASKQEENVNFSTVIT